MKVRNKHTAECCGIPKGEVRDLPEWLARHMVEVLKMGELVEPPKPEPKPEPAPAPKRRGRPRKKFD